MISEPTPIPPRDPAPAGQAETQSGGGKQRQLPPKGPVAREGNSDVTRAGMLWVAVIAGLIVLVLLIIFILQNQDRVTVHYLGIDAELSLGMALFIAAVAGGILVAVIGAIRILQLRRQRRHQRALHPDLPSDPAPPKTAPKAAAPPKTAPTIAAPPKTAPTRFGTRGRGGEGSPG